MKLRHLEMLLLIVLATPVCLHAQHRCWLELRGGYDALLENDHFKHWHSGWLAGAGAACQLLPGMQLVFDAGYHRYAYDSTGLGIMHTMVTGWGYREEGEASYAVETSVALRLHETSRRIGLFFTARGGLYYLHTGQIKLIDWPVADPTAATFETYPGTNQSVIKPFGSVGLGFRVPVADRISILLESGFSSTYDGYIQLFPMHATVQYRL